MAATIAQTGSGSTGYRRRHARRAVLVGTLAVALLCSLLLDIVSGPSGLGAADLLRVMLHPDTASRIDRVIVWEVRLPQALMAALVGAARGLAGAEMQTVLN
ncbi:MAG: iron chelate uptake ABC transporter family permease subunit, partial [Microvirgula sp.]